MDTIPSVYWMIIIGAVALMLCFVLYYVAMLLKESKDAVSDSREIMQEANKTLRQLDLIINDVQSSISTVRGTIEEVNQSIIVPVRKLANVATIVSAFVSGLRKEK